MNNIDWFPIPGYENYYEICKLGLIRSKERKIKVGVSYINKTETILRPKLNYHGYLSVRFSVNGDIKEYSVHVLMAKTFIPNPDEKPCIDHINGVRWDNRLENLRRVTHLENRLYGIAKGNTPLTGKKIGQYTLDGILIKEYEAIKHVERDGFNSKGVNRAVLSQRKTYAGFIWKPST